MAKFRAGQDARCQIKISAGDGETDIVKYNRDADPEANRRRVAIEDHQNRCRDLYLVKDPWDD